MLISEKAKADKKFRNSEENIRLREQILEECRFDDTAYGLLDIYREIDDRKKFNKLFLQMIADDQVYYDYLYEGLDSLSVRFIYQYIHFLQYVNSQHKKLVLSKEQIKYIAESILAKHQIVFDLHDSFYYSETDGIYNEYNVRDAIQSMVNLSTWLRQYDLEDLNNKIIKWFFDNEKVMSTLRYDPLFKDFWGYLIQREDFKKYREE